MRELEYASRQLTAIEPTARSTARSNRRRTPRGAMRRDLPRIAPSTAVARARDVFLFFIDGAKERDPAAAMALIERLRD